MGEGDGPGGCGSGGEVGVRGVDGGGGRGERGQGREPGHDRVKVDGGRRTPCGTLCLRRNHLSAKTSS